MRALASKVSEPQCGVKTMFGSVRRSFSGATGA